MIGVIAHKDGDGWFFKMRGNAALTAAEKDHFLKWVASVKPDGPAVPPPSAPAPPAGPSSAAEPARQLTWQVPDGWTPVPGAGSMRYATFTMTGPGRRQGGAGDLPFPRRCRRRS